MNVFIHTVSTYAPRFVRTDVHPAEPSTLNNCANYCFSQVFLDPSAVKTAAYYLKAIPYFIVGTCARVLSLVSREVRREVFADRLIFTIRTYLPQVVTISSAKEENNSVPSSPPAAASSSPPVSTPPKEKLDVKVAFTDQVEIRYVLEETKAFFERFNQLPQDKKQVEEWLNEENKNSPALCPFFFASNFIRIYNSDKERFASFIPEDIFNDWKRAYQASDQKRMDVGLTSDQADGLTEKSKSDPNTLPEEIIRVVSELLQQRPLTEEWLNKTERRSIFFWALVVLSCKEEADPQKIAKIQRLYPLVRDRLYQMGLERYLQNKPSSRVISGGFVALIHVISAELMAPSSSISRPSPTPNLEHPHDTALKEVVRNMIPSMVVVLSNEKFFQKMRASLLNYVQRWWLKHTEFLENFSKSSGNKTDLKQKIEKAKIGYTNLPLFSDELLTLLDISAPFLLPGMVSRWKELRAKCCILLNNKLKQEKHTEKKLSDWIKEKRSELVKNSLHWFSPMNKFFTQILEERDPIKVGILLKKAKADPFFGSLDIALNLTLGADIPKDEEVSRWIELYPKVCDKLEALNLVEYLEEVPDREFNELKV